MAAQRELCTANLKLLEGPVIRRVVGRAVVEGHLAGPLGRDKTVRELYDELLVKIFKAWGNPEFRQRYESFYAEVKAGQERPKTRVDWFYMLPQPKDGCATDGQLFLLAEKSGGLSVLVHDFVKGAANKRDGLGEVARIVRRMKFGGKPLMAKLADNIQGAVNHLQSKYDLDEFADIS